MRVLIVDDNSLSGSLARKGLQSKGMLCRNAIHGLDALKWLEKEMFDLILLDIFMPIMDGYETTRRIRKGEIGSINRNSIPILAYTSACDIDVKEHCLALGMNDVLDKLETTDKLYLTIEKYDVDDFSS